MLNISASNLASDKLKQPPHRGASAAGAALVGGRFSRMLRIFDANWSPGCDGAAAGPGADAGGA